MRDRLGRLPELRAVAQSRVDQIVDLTERICRVPAPSCEELERAALVAEEFQQRGLNAETDEIGNVIARRPGAGSGRTLMLAAHTDTVFPRETLIQIERRNGVVVGPSIGDNSLGVAVMLEVVSLLDEAGIETPGDVLFVANVGEEGLGNLRGIRAVTERFALELGGVIAVEGHNLGRVTHVAVGSKRIRITVTGPGGHSWGAFGEPSAVHELGRIITQIADLQVPSEPKTAYNVGVIEGGVSVNTIAPRASGVVDMRSIDADALATLASRVETIARSRQTDQVNVEIEVLGERPAGQTPASATIVRTAVDVLAGLGMVAELNASSTDANVPIAMGIPAICIGLTHGERSHRTDESIQIAPIGDGLTQLAMLVAAFPVD